MTADWCVFFVFFRTQYIHPDIPLRYVFPPEVLRRISNRITNEVAGINRVTYDISSKPPAASLSLICFIIATELITPRPWSGYEFTTQALSRP